MALQVFVLLPVWTTINAIWVHLHWEYNLRTFRLNSGRHNAYTHTFFLFHPPLSLYLILLPFFIMKLDETIRIVCILYPLYTIIVLHLYSLLQQQCIILSFHTNKNLYSSFSSLTLKWRAYIEMCSDSTAWEIVLDCTVLANRGTKKTKVIKRLKKKNNPD